MPLQPAPAVLRAVDILEQLASQPDKARSVSDLARDVGIPRATCHTVLLALAERGYVHRDAELRYALGPSCAILGDAAEHAVPALHEAFEQAEALARAVAGFAVVSVPTGNATRVVRTFDHGPALSLRVRVGETVPIVAPFGASIVAWADDVSVERWLVQADPRLDEHEVERHRAALDIIRERGFVITIVAERPPGTKVDRAPNNDAAPSWRRRSTLAAAWSIQLTEHLPTELPPSAPLRIAQVSAPVFAPGGTVTATIMVLGPAFDVTGTEAIELGHRVKAAADRATTSARTTHP